MKRSSARLPFAVAVATFALATCGGEPAMDEAAQPAEMTAQPPTLQAAVDLGVRNAKEPIPGVVTGGQPTQEQLEGLGDAGYRHFISLRPTSEEGAGWEEALVPGWGYDFERLEIADAGSLTRENVETFARMLEQAGGEPTVVYCASGNRVGAMLALKAHWIDGVGAEDALQLGLSAGMTRLEAPVRELLGLGSGG